MERTRTKRNKKSKSQRCVYICLFIILLFPLNYNGKTIRIKTSLDPISTSSSRSYEKSTITFHKAIQASTPSTLAKDEDKSSPEKLISNLLAAFSSISLILITILSSIIIGYLNSVTVVKKCLLSYLYQDATKIFLCLHWLWWINLLLCFQTGNNEMILEQKITTKLLCFVVTVTNLQLLCTLNIMCAVQLWMRKELILDPPLPWGYDEHDIINRIRLTPIVFILGIAAMYGLDSYPFYYYKLTGDFTRVTNLPVPTQILSAMFVILTLSFLGMYFTNMIYRQTIVFQEPGEDQRNRKPNPSLAFSIIVAAILIIHIVMFEVVSPTLWLVHLIDQILTGVLFPGYAILTLAELKKYAKKIINNIMEIFHKKLENLSSYTSHLFRHFQRNSSQVQPTA